MTPASILLDAMRSPEFWEPRRKRWYATILEALSEAHAEIGCAPDIDAPGHDILALHTDERIAAFIEAQDV